MKIRIVIVGNLSLWTREALKHFEKLLSRFCKLEVIRLKAGGDINKENWNVILKREAKSISSKIKGKMIVLDVNGKNYSSEEFAKFLQNFENVTFVIGGSIGLDESIKERADHIISLSSMTLSHEVALVVLLEQLFRGFKILKGERYNY